MDIDSKSSAQDPVPEVEIYFRLLIIYTLLNSSESYTRALQLAKETSEKILQLNRRSMDPIAAKVWYAVDRAYELGGELADARPYVLPLPSCICLPHICYRLLLSAQRTASLRHDDESQAALINCLLRNYIHYSLFDQADKLISKTTFPSSASNPQFARYHYYLGRIKVVQLDYTEAHRNLQQAIRRSPQPRTAPGFYQAVHKFFIVVELLMGDIPDRSLFRHPVLEKALIAYFDIVKGIFIVSFHAITQGLKYFSRPYRVPLPIPNHTLQTL
jgi:26S proteasome regulatory subunit N3